MDAWAFVVSVAGVSIILAVLVATGAGRGGRLDGVDAVRAFLREQAPEWSDAPMVLDAGGRGALVLGDDVGALVWVLGRRFVVRELQPGDLRVAEDDERVRVRVRDLAWPPIELRVGPADLPRVRAWRAR